MLKVTSSIKTASSEHHQEEHQDQDQDRSEEPVLLSTLSGQYSFIILRKGKNASRLSLLMEIQACHIIFFNFRQNVYHCVCVCSIVQFN